MTTWTPNISAWSGAKYLVIADAVEKSICCGELAAGARLPTHRELADQLGVTVGTVTRAYAELQRRGLTFGEVGRGSFVGEPQRAAAHGWAADASDDRIDMSLSLPAPLPDGSEPRRLASTLREIAGSAGLEHLIAYDDSPSTQEHLASGRSWLQGLGLWSDEQQITMTSGAQHALVVAFSALLRPGDSLLTEALTYPGAKAAARMLQLRMRPIEMDAEGIVPEALESACVADPHARALYVVPTIQNPTGALMSEARRDSIAEVATRHGLWIIEDDVHAPGMERPPRPISQRVPERSVHVISTGKTLGPALRMAFVGVPGDLMDRFGAAIRSTIWRVPPLMAAVTANWIDTGVANEILAARRAEANRRHDLAMDRLRAYGAVGHRDSFYVWLPLPEPWRSDEFVQQALQRGVLLAGAGAFTVGRHEIPHAVRLSLGQSPTPTLVRGLDEITALLDGAAEPCVNLM